ncbi:SHOCT domain-containing protein [Gordonia sp. PKS22-38]|uniref:SHOCT domain-containing protein n=1 Tax=Gordonia prachuapensis TaxID=3115651 RepID=A0ABU7MW02_9ACTN|nr:SHOCT domain-containing protein [Gordonia sp. PKS22-38]
MWDSFWDFIWYTVVIFIFVAYLMMLFWIIADLFRDRDLSGWWKAVWMVFLIFVPWVTALVYLIARGPGMSRRAEATRVEMQQQSDDYIRSVAGKSSAEQIADAKSLLDTGVIDEQEYAALKAKALR